MVRIRKSFAPTPLEYLNMAIKIICECGKKFSAEEEYAGRTVTCPAGGEWAGSKNVFDTAVTPPGGEVMPGREAVTATAAWAPGQPFPGRGADASEMRIPPRPVPHPAAGRFTTLARPGGE